MKIHPITQICAWSLSIFFLCSTQVYAQSHTTPTQLRTETRETPLISSREAILTELTKADVIYLGENHDSPDDHKAQLEILQALYQRNPKIAIAMEMFQRPYQSILDQYLSSKITETELVQQTEYEQRWGFPWEYYAPLLRFAKQNQLPVLALNTPSEVTRKVASSGLESLTTQEQQYIPPLDEIRTDNTEYRQMIQEIYQHHQQGNQGNSSSFDRFFTAQVLWDETMAEVIAKFISANPEYQVVVIAGRGHIMYDYGIPSRVSRRLNTSELLQHSVLFGVRSETEAEGENAIADFFW